MSKRGRTAAHRRDRRKAKASNWTRAGKTKMGRVAHGPNGNTLPPPGGLALDVEPYKPDQPSRLTSKIGPALRAKLGDIAAKLWRRKPR